jgi:hypothetical protein
MDTNTEQMLSLHVCRLLLEWMVALFSGMKSVLIQWEAAGTYAIATLQRAAGAPKPQQEVIDTLIAYLFLSVILNIVLSITLCNTLIKKSGAIKEADHKATPTLPK